MPQFSTNIPSAKNTFKTRPVPYVWQTCAPLFMSVITEQTKRL